MRKIIISTKNTETGCVIYIGKGIIQKFNELVDTDWYSNIAVIADKTVSHLYFPAIKKACNRTVRLIIIPAQEKDKTIRTALLLWKQFLRFGLDRKSLVVNLGGGVVGDIGGFAASAYMRGIDFVQVPTTLLAQVDASVGGKVGVNFNGLKNMIGSFTEPRAVVCDESVLRTLPDREFIAGFAEIIKHGAIASSAYFRRATGKKPREFSSSELTALIAGSVKIKAEIVEEDEREAGTRKKLNFGHTVGHALESLSLEAGESLLHGEAVAIGMAAEARLSVAAGLLSEKACKLLENALMYAGLPIRAKYVNIARLLKKIEKDKKNTGGIVQWTLIKRIGLAVVDQAVENDNYNLVMKRFLNTL